MKATIEQLYIALGQGDITVDQFMEVLIDNLGKRQAYRLLKREIPKYLNKLESDKSGEDCNVR